MGLRVADSRAHVLDALDATLEAVRQEAWLHFTVADLAQGAMWLALSGSQDRARQYLDDARSIPQLTSVWSDAVVGLADAALAASRADDALAARLIEAELATRPLDDPSADLAHRPWLAVS